MPASQSAFVVPRKAWVMVLEDDSNNGNGRHGRATSPVTIPWCGPLGPRPVATLDDLPPQDTTRWVVRRKAQVVEGVRTGVISLEQACELYSLSVEEFRSWQRRFEREGLPGLSARTRRHD